MLTFSPDWTVFDAPVQTIVNTVNCVGVMGKGLALEVKNRFPVVYLKYRKACESETLDIGKLQLVKTPATWILNFPTKRHWRFPSKLADIEAGLKKFAWTYKRRGITSVAFPPLGCGAGGLKWEDVRPLMEKYLGGLDGIAIYVCLAPPKHVSMTDGQSG
ncbi:MAG: macro domain-containing protein [Terriglobia bacterium]|jgi:O-acetyl-ADP-ribose deacetylase (regulator of RNase III)